MTLRPHAGARQGRTQRLDQLDDVVVSDGNTFGHTGGARGVDHVGDYRVVGAGAGNASRMGDR